jgi:hypothetical protein
MARNSNNEQDKEIYKNYYNWGNSIREYHDRKKSLEWGSNPKPQVITHKIVKDRENIFNPISQLYYDDNLNKQMKSIEKVNIKNSIAKNYDRTLRMEQTYNLVNLKDKLKGFEGHPDYPAQQKEPAKKNLEVSKANYNILSNITLDKHNFLPYEKRPIIVEEKEELKPIKMNVVNFKDYDVISNKYKFNHDEKVKVDFKVSELNAANNYWKSRDYDFIRGRYIEDNKEDQFQLRRSEDQKIGVRVIENMISSKSNFYFINNLV